MNDPAEKIIVTCSACGANNRISREKAAISSAVCGKCRKPLPPPVSEPVTVTDSNFEKVVASSPLPVLLDMWAAWCGPCRMIAPTIKTLAGELAGRVLVGKMDVDANPQTAARFRVQSIPTLLVLKNGREMDRIVGVQSKEAIVSRLARSMN